MCCWLPYGRDAFVFLVLGNQKCNSGLTDGNLCSAWLGAEGAGGGSRLHFGGRLERACLNRYHKDSSGTRRSWWDKLKQYLRVTPTIVSHSEGNEASAGATHQQPFLFPVQVHFKYILCNSSPLKSEHLPDAKEKFFQGTRAAPAARRHSPNLRAPARGVWLGIFQIPPVRVWAGITCYGRNPHLN